MKYKIIITVLLIAYFANGYTQNTFQTVNGNKANYTIQIPTSFKSIEAIGANIDLKYGDKKGASIVTLIRKLPNNITDDQIVEMSYLTDKQVINQYENEGMQNVTLIKRGFLSINSIKSYFIYYTALANQKILYYHTISQFVKGKMFNLTITCDYSDKTSYMPYIYRVTNSIVYL